MNRLAISVLGMPRVDIAGVPLAVDRRKAVALLVFLALSDVVRGRDALATLFWPGYDQATARGNLRRTLSVLHTALREDWLLIDRDTVALRRDDDLWLDVLQFERLLAACQTHDHPADQVCPCCLEPLTQAVALYRDDFLTGFTLPDAPDFDDWQRYQTERLRSALSGALDRLAQCLAAQSDFSSALAHVRRRVALDPLDESAQRQLMQTLAWAGDRGAALRQYQAFVELLRREVQAAPAPETTALYAAISQNRLEPPAPLPPSTPLPQPLPGAERGDRIPLFADREEPVLSASKEGPGGLGGELRPVTILCAGLGGETDPEAAATGVAGLLAAMETLLSRYQARLERVLGDSVIAVFGAGQVHEDDAERAIIIACALLPAARASVEATIGHAPTGGQAAATVSVGIATGEAYFGPAGTGEQAGVAVLGPLVNRAARLQSRAIAGQVLADQATYARTRLAFTYRAVDGDRERTEAQTYEVVGALARPAKTRGIEGLRAALTGRDAELAKLTAALARVRAGRGQIVTLIGEAGLGKSRLVTELKARSESAASDTLLHVDRQSTIRNAQSAIVWLEGRGLEMAASTSYGPFVDLLRGYFGAAAVGGAPCDPSLLACAVRDMLQAFRDEGRLTTEQVEEIGPLLGNLLSLRFGDDWDERLRMADPGQIRHRTFAALRTFFAALADRQPTVLVLEDLHWADALTIDLIGELIGLLGDHPLLLLCVYRPGREYGSERLTALAERRCAGRATELRLRALTPAESRQMLASLLTVEGLPAQAREVIVAQGEGNPFFTEEIVRELIDAGLLYRDGPTWRARARIEVARAPEGVQGVILSRVDRLAAGERQVLQAAAVLGRLFRPRVLARLVSPDLNLDTALDRLAERDFVYQERTWPEAEYSFKHVLTQQAVYGTLLAARKTSLHRQAGTAIEALYADNLAEHYEALAHHYDRGDAGEKTIEYLLKAGEKARCAYLNDEAISYFERTLARCEQAVSAAGPGGGNDAARLEALTGLGKVHFLVGRFVEAEGGLRKAISLGRELGLAPAQLVQLYFWLGDSLYWLGRQEEQGQVGQEGLALLGDAVESAETAMMSYFVAIGLRFAGDEERFWERVARIAQYLGSLPYREELRTVYSGVAMFEFLRNKDIEGGRRWLAALEQHGRRHHDRRALCEVLVGRAIIQLRSGSCQSALDYDARALHECMQIGDVPNGVQAYEMLCAHNLALGKLDEAEAWARRSLEDWMGGNDPTRVPWSLITQSVVRLCRRDYPGASAVIQEIGELIPRVGPYRQFLMSCTLAGIKLALGLRTEARAEYATIFRSMRPALVCSWSQRAWLRPHLPALLHGLAEAYGDSKAFWAFCRDYQTRHPDVATRSLQQWHLEPAMTEPVQRVARLARDFGWETVEGLRADGWRWSDPCGDSSFELQPAIGLVMCAGNGRELFFTNQSAPRLLGPMSGDFEAEVVCLAVDDRPAIGGLLLWRDGKNYVRVEWGRYGRREVLFEGCVANMDADYGCGCLPIETQRVFLRLARRGERVDALCSADGETWWSVGHAAFPVDDPVQIGLCAIGMIDRTIYPGAYREGTAIRFEAFRLW